eukprot:5028507-Prorocentrum_lima.AAC.1
MKEHAEGLAPTDRGLYPCPMECGTQSTGNLITFCEWNCPQPTKICRRHGELDPTLMDGHVREVLLMWVSAKT